MIKAAIYDIVNGKDLSLERTREVMDQIMNGQATNAQIASFLTAMRMKGETIDEITACAMVMRDKCTKIFPKTDVLDIVGTGGDEVATFNISTVSALVIAAGGVPVAKHGNRSVSSKCGSADLLEALGVNIELSAEKSAVLLDELGICFMFAPTYHASMKYAGPVRKELGIRTIFNILGPLANPAGANMQLLGVYDENLVEPLAALPVELADWDLTLKSDGGELEYSFDANAEDTGVPSLIRRLEGLNIGFKDLNTRQSSLEDIFVSLVHTNGAAA